MVGWLMNGEFETMWMEAIVAWSEEFSLYLKIQALWGVTSCSWVVLSVHRDLFAPRYSALSQET